MLIYDSGLSDTFSAGNAYTDLPMLKRSGYAFIPEDSPDVLKGYGSVIPACSKGGMEMAFDLAYDILKKRN